MILGRSCKKGYEQDMEKEIIRLLDEDYEIDGGDLDPDCQAVEHLILPGGIECDHYHSTVNVAMMGGVVAVMTRAVFNGEAGLTLITDHFYDQLSDNGKRFILAHEVGHIINGHISSSEEAINAVAAGNKIDNVIADSRDIKIEFVADDFAVNHNGLKSTLQAMKELKRLFQRNPWVEIDYDEINRRIQHVKRSA